MFNFARNLVLTGGELFDGLPQRCEILNHLLHLRRVEGGAADVFGTTVSGAVCASTGAGGFSELAGGFVQPSSWTQPAILCLASGDRPSSGALVAITSLVVSP